MRRWYENILHCRFSFLGKTHILYLNATGICLQREEADVARQQKSEREQAHMEQQKLELKRLEEQVQYQRELELQLVEKERRRQEAYEEFLKEKLLVDEIVRKIHEEDQR